MSIDTFLDVLFYGFAALSTTTAVGFAVMTYSTQKYEKALRKLELRLSYLELAAEDNAVKQSKQPKKGKKKQ